MALKSVPAQQCQTCAGGGEVNGVPCRDCQGTRQSKPAPARTRKVWKRLTLTIAAGAGHAARLSLSLPGLAGSAAVALGGAMVLHGLVPAIPELGVGLVLGGAFLLLIDRNLS